MELWIYDDSVTRIGVVDEFESCIWTRRYQTWGDFELVVPADAQNLALLQQGFFVMRADSPMVCRIEKVNLKTSVENGDKLIVSGTDVLKMLNQRIVWTQTNYTGTAEGFIRKIINENAISPTETGRAFPNWILGTAKGYSDAIEIQSTYDYVGDKVIEICQTFGYGLAVTYSAGKFVFDIYKGSVKPVVFSDDYGNISGTDYLFDANSFKNVALVAGEGEGNERKRKEVGSAEGFGRFEAFVDAKSLSSKTDDGQLTPSEYEAALAQAGDEALASAKAKESFNGETQRYQFFFGTDYDMGDIVTIGNDYGLQTYARVSEVIESESEQGYTLVPNFSLFDDGMIEQGAVITQDRYTINTEQGQHILSQGSMGNGVKITQLPEAESVNPTDPLVIVNQQTTKKVELQTIIDAVTEAVMEQAHPIGSYYWSDYSTDPGTLFGGTWERIKDVFLLAAGDTYAAGSTGGEATHTLTTNEMPEHQHQTIEEGYSVGFRGNISGGAQIGVWSGVDGHLTGNAGGGQPHNNMPPYVAKYCWHRIA